MNSQPIAQKAKIIHFNNTWWIRANPIAEALGYSDPNKFILNHVQLENLKSYEDIKPDYQLMIEFHPTTKFINQQGLSDLLTAKNQVELLTWIEREFVPEQQQMSCISSILKPEKPNTPQADDNTNDEPPTSSENTGLIYVATTNEWKDRQIYKIGVTSDLKSRITQLNTGTFEDWYCVFTFETSGYKQLEIDLHQIFKHCRIKINREFFTLTEADIENIKNVCIKFVPPIIHPMPRASGLPVVESQIQDTHHNQIAELNKTIIGMRETIIDLQKNKITQNNQISELNKTIIDMRETHTKQFAELNKHFDWVQTNLTQNNNHIAELNKTIIDMQETHAKHVDSVQTNLTQHNNRIAELNKTIIDMQETHAKQFDRAQTMFTQHNNLISELTRQKNELTRLIESQQITLQQQDLQLRLLQIIDPIPPPPLIVVTSGKFQRRPRLGFRVRPFRVKSLTHLKPELI